MTMWITLNDKTPRDFLAEADVSLAEGAPNTQVGMLFRVQDTDNFYSYYIDGEGNYALWKLVDNEWQEIIPSTPSDLLDTSEGAVNRLGVLAQGPTIALLINDEIVDQTTDDTFAGGQIALSVGTVDEANATGRFDNFDLWVQAEATPEDLGLAPAPAEDAEQRLADTMATDPTFTDNFSRDNGNWSLDSDETATYEIKGRKLHITVDKENWLAWTTYSGDAPVDFLAAVDGTVPEDSPVGEYGIVFRSVDDTNFYIAALSTDGYFGVWKNVDGEWTAIADWTPSDLIDLTPEAVNRLAVLAEGAQFTLYINDVPATTVEDDTFAEGDTGPVRRLVRRFPAHGYVRRRRVVGSEPVADWLEKSFWEWH